MCFWKCEISAVKLPGPLVYVVTPSPRPPQIDKGRSAPFYYHNWMRRMDTSRNATTSISSTTTPKSKTPDLIFAEFESGNTNNMKSIRKLLEREKTEPETTTTTTTTLQPIYVPEEEPDDVTRVVNYGLPVMTEEKAEEPSSETDSYFSMYNKIYNGVPVYLSSTRSTSSTVNNSPVTKTTTTTTTSVPVNVENIWHIIDNEKYNQYSGNWEEQPLSIDNTEEKINTLKSQNEAGNIDDVKTELNQDPIDENFALPG